MKITKKAVKQAQKKLREYDNTEDKYLMYHPLVTGDYFDGFVSYLVETSTFYSGLKADIELTTFNMVGDDGNKYKAYHNRYLVRCAGCSRWESISPHRMPNCRSCRTKQGG